VRRRSHEHQAVGLAAVVFLALLHTVCTTFKPLTKLRFYPGTHWERIKVFCSLGSWWKSDLRFSGQIRCCQQTHSA
jgi:hypothetical protein